MKHCVNKHVSLIENLKFNHMFTTVWGWGWSQSNGDMDGDGDRCCRDGAGMVINTVGMVGDGDKLLFRAVL